MKVKQNINRLADKIEYWHIRPFPIGERGRVGGNALCSVLYALPMLLIFVLLPSRANAQGELARADITVCPQLGDVTAMDLARSAECIDAGSFATRQAVPSIKSLLINKNIQAVLHYRHPHHEKA